MPRRLSTTSSVQKTARILCALSDPATRQLKHIAAATGIDKASVLRILNELCDEGLVHRKDSTKSYSYGVEMYAISAALSASANLRAVARPSLVRLAALSGDSVMLLVRSGIESVCLDRENGDFPIQAGAVDIGSRRPLASGSGSLALIAWLGRDEAEALLELVRPKIARYPGLSRTVLRNEIRAARTRGYTMFVNTIVDRIAAIACPVFAPDGHTIGALSVSSLSERLAGREKFLATALMREAESIQAAMKGTVDEPGVEDAATTPRKSAAPSASTATRRRRAA
jgi:DNA-binding IclR family transcriptional regulator